MKRTEHTVILAGGGTGGHLFPGIALARELMARPDSPGIVFATSSKSLDRKLLNENGFETKQIGTAGWKKGMIKYPFMMLSVLWSVSCSFLFIMKTRCKAVIGLGGYASFGPILAGYLLRKKIFILEQNTIPGKANRFLARFSKHVFIQFPSSASYFREGKPFAMGNPVRKEIIELRGREPGKSFSLLVMGGSQGAEKLNEIFIDSCSRINFPENFGIIHLCGERNLDACTKRYEEKDIDAGIDLIGFQKDMASLIGKAGLCLCRSGATSIAELTCAGVPLVMVPYPYATDDHQFQNGSEIEKLGAGVCVREEDLTPEKLSDILNGLIGDREKLEKMRECSLKAGRPEAGAEIADFIMKRIAG